MKKLYQTPKWVKFNEKKSDKEIRKRQKKNKKSTKKRTSKQAPVSLVAIKKRKGRIEIPAPTNFSLINNVDETLSFFNTMNKYIKDHKDIFLDMSAVQELTTDTILYILSYLEFNRSNFQSVQISGNEPAHDDCREILRSSGFFKHVYSTGVTKLKSDPHIFSIESGIKVLSPVAASIKQFTKDRLKISESREAKSIYENIIECMANTRQHAYTEHSMYYKWWIMASFNAEADKIHFTFLDNGQSIPTTLRKNFGERVKDMFSKSGLIAREQDGLLLESALKGEFRTRTLKKYRGKGLPRIYESVEQKRISDLIILSRRGYINKSKQTTRHLDSSIRGTLLSWNFINSN